MKILSLLLIVNCYIYNLGIAQDGYYGKPSDYIPNEFDPNSTYNFDYKMTGVLSDNRRNNRYPFTLYVNSADGSMAITDGAMTAMIGRPASTRSGKFDFAVISPNSGIRMYYTVNDPDEGEKKVYYTINRNLSAPALQLEFAQAEIFHRFMQNATKTPAGNHRAFGPQTLYSGQINGKNYDVTISARSAKVRITPAHVGFLCGVFSDDDRLQNRYITKFKTEGITVEMHSFSPANFILPATGYLHEEGQSSYNVESMVNNEGLIKEINERIGRLTNEMMDAARSGDSDRISIISLKSAIETQRLQAIKNGHPERQIPEETATELVNLKSRILQKTKECQRNEGTEYEDECTRRLSRLQSQFKELYDRYFSY